MHSIVRFITLLCLLVAFLQIPLVGLSAEDKPDIPEDIRKKLEELKKRGGGEVISLEDDEDDGYDPYKNAVPMRWRVYSSQEHGVAFRFPYFYSTPDQYEPRIVRRPSWFMRDGEFKADIELKSKTVKGKSVFGGGGLAAEAKSLIGIDDMVFADYDYYQSPTTRLHANPKWAPAGVKALIGQSSSHVAMVLQYGDKLNALVCKGPMDKYNNQEILDTFEVMERPTKNRKREKGPLMTFRESTFMDGQVLNFQGVPVKTNVKDGPVIWGECWEVETAHYHITCQVNSARLYYYAALCEALYREFYDLYQPESVIPYKMEIHLFNTFNDFQSSAASIGFPVSFGVGGFFAPGLLCIFAYEKSTEVAPDFTPSKVIAHEMSHQFLHLTCNGSDHVPTWLNEGLAVYFETFDFKRGKYISKAPRSRISQLVMAYSQTKNVLWSMDNYIKHYGHIPALNYAEVYAMTHFWVFGAGKAGKRRFVEYWKALKDGEDGTEAFEEIFLKDIIQAKGSRSAAIYAWEDELKKYVLNVLARIK